MKPKLILRIASILLFLHALGHSAGTLTWQKPGGDMPGEVVQKMQEIHFNFMGKESTMATLFSGNGFSGIILLLLLSVLLWIVSDWNNKPAVKILWIVVCAIILLAADEIVFFFPMAYAFCLLSAILVFISIFRINKLTN